MFSSSLKNVCILMKQDTELHYTVDELANFVNIKKYATTVLLSQLQIFLNKLGCAYHLNGNVIVIRRVFSDN